MSAGVRIIMFGRQGAGKGTQSARLAKYFEVPHISTGEMLRNAVKQDSVVEVTGWAHQNVVPVDSPEYQVRNWDVAGEYITKTHPIQRKKIQPSFSGYGVSLNSFSSAFLWDGKPKGQSQTC